MSIKDMRYNVMVALYFPILLYALSTFDISEETFAVRNIEPVVVADDMILLGQPFTARAFLAVGTEEGQVLTGSGDLQAMGDSLFEMQTGKLLAQGETEKDINYAGTFQFRQLGGNTVDFPVAGTFKLRRPEIVAVSQGTEALYRACRNEIRIDVPGLEDRVIKLNGQATRTITLAPSGESAGVQVSLAQEGGPDIFLGSKSFSVIDPPRPEIRVQNAGRDIRNGDNLPRGRFAITFAVEADEQFRQRFPQDARYAVGRARVFLRRGLTASEELGTFSLEGGRLPVIRQLGAAAPGDRVIIRLESVSRINYAGSAVSVDLNEGSRTFSFTIS